MARVVLIVLGVVAGCIAIGMLVAGGAILALVGSDGFVDSGTHPIKTETSALVTRPARITDAAERVGDLGDITIRTRIVAGSTGPVFVGIGRTADVTRYLASFDHSVIRDVDFDPFRLMTTDVSAVSAPGGPPGEETFWNAKAIGSGTVTLDWKVQDGDWRLVIMNEDGIAPVHVDGLLGVKVPFARPLGIILLVVGALAAILGVVLIVLGIRAKPKPRTPPAPAGFAVASSNAPSAAWPATPGAAAPDAPAPPPEESPPAS